MGKAGTIQRPHYYLPGTVVDAAINRMRWIFDEFDNKVVVSTSGGKDSTVILELAALVNNERGQPRGPLKAHFLDQEAEYGATVNYMRYLMNDRPDIKLAWYQVPFRLMNSTSYAEQWAHPWAVGEEWMRPKEPNSIHVNPFKDHQGRPVDRFKPMLACMTALNPDHAHIAGLRVEESPTRRVLMTGNAGYKWVTWSSGSVVLKRPWQFYPIYDWSHRDIWRSILERGWVYNAFYDVQFQRGTPLPAMRVSSFHHEQSMMVLDYLQEAEPDTWEAATRRLPGISTHSHVGKAIYEQYWQKLPYMFSTWMEYLDHLLANLIPAESDRAKFRKMQSRAEHQLPHVPRREIARYTVRCVLFNDVDGSNMHAWADAQYYPVRQKFWETWKRENMALGQYDPSEEIGRTL
jgi:predicted phosphoadenosine phosphosulfate sulfurtransferase